MFVTFMAQFCGLQARLSHRVWLLLNIKPCVSASDTDTSSWMGILSVVYHVDGCRTMKSILAHYDIWVLSTKWMTLHTVIQTSGLYLRSSIFLGVIFCLVDLIISCHFFQITRRTNAQTLYIRHYYSITLQTPPFQNPKQRLLWLQNDCTISSILITL